MRRHAFAHPDLSPHATRQHRLRTRPRRAAVLAVLVGLTTHGTAFATQSVASGGITPAGIINVTTTADVVASDGVTSLREAISQANSSAGTDTINLLAAVYPISISCGGDDDANAGGDLDITASDLVSIEGPSSASRAVITLDASCTDERLIDLRGVGALTVANVDLVNGEAPDATTADTDGANGGAIRSNTASLTLVNVGLEGNSAGDAGLASTSNTSGGNGGAIYTTARLTLTSVTALDNRAGDGSIDSANLKESGGGHGGTIAVLESLSATVTITDSQFTGNHAGDGADSTGLWGSAGGSGGAVWLAVPTVIISGSEFIDNRAGNSGSTTADNGRLGGEGGALRVQANDLTVTESTFSGNSAGDGASALSNVGNGGGGGAISLSVNGIGSLAATIAGSLFNFNSAGDAGGSAIASGVDYGQSGGGGGAIKTTGQLYLEIDSTSFSFNRAGNGTDDLAGGGTVFGGPGGDGGAIFNWGSTIAVTGSDFSYNYAGNGGVGSSGNGGGAGNGGAIAGDNYALYRPALSVATSVFTGNLVGSRATSGGAATGSGNGGAIYFNSNSTQSFGVESSLFSLNQASAGTDVSGRGGAIYLSGDTPSSITSSTFWGNVAAEDGGALYVRGSTPLTIRYATITDNSAPPSGSSAIADDASTSISIGASVIANSGAGSGPACNLSLTSLGYNAELTTSTCSDLNAATDDLGVAASALGTFSANGGDAGNTRLPSLGGALRDAIPAVHALCVAPPADQRGVSRPANGACDIGAAEVVTTVDAVNDSVDVEYGVEVSLDVLINDSGTSSDSGFASATDLTIIDVSDSVGGTATTDGSTVSYTASSPLGHSFTYTVCHSVEGGVCDTATVNVAVTTPLLNTVGPLRLVDTRPGYDQGAIEVAKELVGGASRLTLQVAGSAGVPDGGALAVALNVTSTRATGPGYITVYPCGTRPLASSLNFIAGRTVANNVVVPLSADGQVCIYASTTTHVVVDISGWFAIEAGFGPIGPVRLVDTRPTTAQGAISVTKQLVGPTTPLELEVAGVGGVPAEFVSAVVLNVTATQATGNGFVRVFPCGPTPKVSSVNYVKGISVANGVIAPLSLDGRLCVSASTPTHVVIDISGYFLAGSGVTGYGPERLVDTRAGYAQGIIPVTKTPIGGLVELRVDLSDVIGLIDVSAVMLNITATQTTGPGFVTLYPCGVRPLASTLNFVAGVNVANGAIAVLSPDNEVCVYASTTTHVIIDMSGYFGPPSVG